MTFGRIDLILKMNTQIEIEGMTLYAYEKHRDVSESLTSFTCDLVSVMR